jgi:hypothetical protein
VCTAVLAACAVSINQAQSAIDRGLRAFDPPRAPRNDAPDITITGDQL